MENLSQHRDITAHLDDPATLERLYREDAEAFRRLSTRPTPSARSTPSCGSGRPGSTRRRWWLHPPRRRRRAAARPTSCSSSSSPSSPSASPSYPGWSRGSMRVRTWVATAASSRPSHSRSGSSTRGRLRPARPRSSSCFSPASSSTPTSRSTGRVTRTSSPRPSRYATVCKQPASKVRCEQGGLPRTVALL